MHIQVLTPVFSVCKVAQDTSIDLSQPYCFWAATDEERSLVCPTARVPEKTLARDDGWRALRVEGTMDFALIGILARLATCLAEKGVAIFAVSTYNTDYILTKQEQFDRAIAALTENGYTVTACADDGN